MLALGQLNLHQYAAPALLPLPCMMSPAFLRILEAIEGVIGFFAGTFFGAIFFMSSSMR